MIYPTWFHLSCLVSSRHWKSRLSLRTLCRPQLGELSHHLNRTFPENCADDFKTHIFYRLLVHLSEFWVKPHIAFEDVALALRSCASILRSRSAVLDSLWTAQNTCAQTPDGMPELPRQAFAKWNMIVPKNIRDLDKTATRMLRDLRDALKVRTCNWSQNTDSRRKLRSITSALRKRDGYVKQSAPFT